MMYLLPGLLVIVAAWALAELWPDLSFARPEEEGDDVLQ